MDNRRICTKRAGDTTLNLSTIDVDNTHLRHILVGHAHIREWLNKNLMLSETDVHDSARDRKRTKEVANSPVVW